MLNTAISQYLHVREQEAIDLVRSLQVPCGNAARAGPAAGEGQGKHWPGHNLLLSTASVASTASGTLPVSLTPFAVLVCA